MELDKKHLNIGILAHVDAGKTTLSEGLLYLGGEIRKLGRVDHGNAFLDTDKQERERGITIFSKQAVLRTDHLEVTLLDTPGHVDFSAEMERTLQVLDYAILVINGMDGVQSHTVTLWRLLAGYGIPVFIFVNKMDQQGTDKTAILKELKKRLNENCMDFGIFTEKEKEEDREELLENLAMCEEGLLERYLETGRVEQEEICRLVEERKVFPCWFGSALKMQGVQEFLNGLEQFTRKKTYPEEFGARVFKIARDPQGNRLTYLKVTGGSLRVKTLIQEEKVDQIRIYSGEKFDMVKEVFAGEICAVTGLSKTHPGQGLGLETESRMPVLEPVLNYQILLPEGCDPHKMLQNLKELEEEEPQLHIVWDSHLGELHAQLMGEVQTEILKTMIFSRCWDSS